MTKSQAALLLTAQYLAAKRRRLYFWTFTADRVMEDREFAQSWNRFMEIVRKRLKRSGESWAALRCFEPHRGDGERRDRAHAHVITTVYRPIAWWRSAAAGTGIGRIMFVRRIKGNRTRHAEYIAKYATKETGLQNCRRWAFLGSADMKADVHCPVKRVKCDWPDARRMSDHYQSAVRMGYRGRQAARAALQLSAQAEGISSQPTNKEALDFCGLRTLSEQNSRAKRAGLPYNWRHSDVPECQEWRHLAIPGPD